MWEGRSPSCYLPAYPAGLEFHRRVLRLYICRGDCRPWHCPVYDESLLDTLLALLLVILQICAVIAVGLHARQEPTGSPLLGRGSVPIWIRMRSPSDDRADRHGMRDRHPKALHSPGVSRYGSHRSDHDRQQASGVPLRTPPTPCGRDAPDAHARWRKRCTCRAARRSARRSLSPTKRRHAEKRESQKRN
jgi:hypothetical protein